MLIAVLAEKLDDAVSEAYAALLTCSKHDKFFEIPAILFIQDFI
jgi:hypothetical protein